MLVFIYLVKQKLLKSIPLIPSFHALCLAPFLLYKHHYSSLVNPHTSILLRLQKWLLNRPSSCLRVCSWLLQWSRLQETSNILKPRITAATTEHRLLPPSTLQRRLQFMHRLRPPSKLQSPLKLVHRLNPLFTHHQRHRSLHHTVVWRNVNHIAGR